MRPWNQLGFSGVSSVGVTVPDIDRGRISWAFDGAEEIRDAVVEASTLHSRCAKGSERGGGFQPIELNHSVPLSTKIRFEFKCVLLTTQAGVRRRRNGQEPRRGA